MMPWDLWHHLGLRRRSRRRREPAVLWRRGRAQGGMGLATRQQRGEGQRLEPSRDSAEERLCQIPGWNSGCLNTTTVQ